MRAEVEKALEVLRSRQPGATEQALALLQDTVYSFSMKVCGHREDAEDTMQNTLLKAMKHLGKFESGRALAVWLYKVAKNCCLMSRRKSKFAPKEHLSIELLMPDRNELERLAAQSTPEYHLLRNESAGQLQKAILKLPPEYRIVLVLHDMEEMSAEEIAQVTGLTPGNVRVRLHRARVFLRNALTGARKTAARRKPARPLACKDLFASLSHYLDGALDAEKCEVLEKHLDGCQPCQVFLDSLRQTVELVRKHPPARLNPKTAARIREKLLAQYREAVAGLPQ
jgi:RNA polymerase sigma-70 factor (ECF subfamily)